MTSNLPLISRNVLAKGFLLLSTVLAVSVASRVSAQSVLVTDDPGTPNVNSNALLDIRLVATAPNSAKGLLIPRVSRERRVQMVLNDSNDQLTERGMLVYQYDDFSVSEPRGFYAWDGLLWQRILDTSFSLDEEDPTWNGVADETGSIRREGNVGIGLTTGAAAERLQVTGNILLSRGGNRDIFIQTPAAGGTNGDALLLRAGSVLGSGSGSSIANGGNLILQAGSGNRVASNDPVGGNVLIRSGANNSAGTNNGGDIVFEIGNNSNTFNERMRINRLGKVTINDLTNATDTRVVTASPTGELGGLALGSAGQVLVVNGGGNGVAWGSAASSLQPLTIENGLAGTSYNGSTATTIKLGGALTENTTITQGGFTFALAGNTISLNNNAAGAATNIGTGTTTGNVQLCGGNNLLGIGGAPTGSYKFEVFGRVKSTGINETSDARLKKNFASVENALEKVQMISGKYYDWRVSEFPNMGFEEGRQIGVIAQEIEKVLPEVVTTDETGFKSVEYGHIVPLLIEAIKEQQAIIDGQQAEISAMKGMKNELDVLKASVELLSEHIKTSQK